MATPEKNLWNRLKTKLPKGTHKTRVENRAGTGVPDVHLCVAKTAFWVELKCTKGDTVSIRPSQIAWNMQYSAAGGISFFLVSRVKPPCLFLFDGGEALRLATDGLGSGSPARPSWAGDDLASCVSFMIDRASSWAR